MPAATLAPTADDIADLARATIASLPEPHRRALADVVLRIEEFAGDAVLDELGIEDPFDLTGLYSGRSGDGARPDTIHLFRRPLLEEWIETGVTLEALIRHVTVHEAGHHLGLSDADLRRIEDTNDA